MAGLCSMGPDEQQSDSALQRDRHAMSARHLRLVPAALCLAWLPTTAKVTTPVSHAALTGLHPHLNPT